MWFHFNPLEAWRREGVLIQLLRWSSSKVASSCEGEIADRWAQKTPRQVPEFVGADFEPSLNLNQNTLLTFSERR